MGGETLQRPATEQQASGRYHWTVDSFYFGNFIAKAGSGGFGGEGFVGVEDADGQLQWLAFFNDSNPFVRLSMEGNILEAVSNTGNS
ncbi:MAG: hypothetical protein WCP07_13160 [bacterium]|jgi:hypothetical protein